MRKYTKAEGGYIDIFFSEPLVNDFTGQEDCFTVTVPEYNWIPGGEIINVVKPVVATFMKSSFNDILKLDSAESVTNVVGTDTITLASNELHGEAIWHIELATNVTKIYAEWDAHSSSGISSVSVSYSYDGISYFSLGNGETFDPARTTTELYFRIALDTNDVHVTPGIKDFIIDIHAVGDDRHMILEMGPYERINNAVGPVTVSYDKTNGNLQGVEGDVESFTRQFTPVDILLKPNPMVTENVTIAGIQGTGTRTRVYYTDAYTSEHVGIANITAIGTRTNVKDL